MYIKTEYSCKSLQMTGFRWLLHTPEQFTAECEATVKTETVVHNWKRVEYTLRVRDGSLFQAEGV